jgi:hypothetical protein
MRVARQNWRANDGADPSDRREKDLEISPQPSHGLTSSGQSAETHTGKTGVRNSRCQGSIRLVGPKGHQTDILPMIS